MVPAQCGRQPGHRQRDDDPPGNGAINQLDNSYYDAKIRAENVVEFAHRVGIESKLDAVPSLCLGTSDVSLFELVGAYSTFVNGGINTEPFFITRIEDKNGNVIENFVPKTKQAIDEQTAFKMVYMLRGGTEERGGTSMGLSPELRKDNEIGGKTGTTKMHRMVGTWV